MAEGEFAGKQPADFTPDDHYKAATQLLASVYDDPRLDPAGQQRLIGLASVHAQLATYRRRSRR